MIAEQKAADVPKITRGAKRNRQGVGTRLPPAICFASLAVSLHRQGPRDCYGGKGLCPRIPRKDDKTMSDFEMMGLPRRLVKALTNMGMTDPTPNLKEQKILMLIILEIFLNI